MADEQTPAPSEAGPGPADGSLHELATLLDQLSAYPNPPPRPRQSVIEYRDTIQMAAFRSGIQAQIERIKGVSQLRWRRLQEDGRDLDGPYVRRLMAQLADRLGLTQEGAKSLTVAQAVANQPPPPPPPPKDGLKPVELGGLDDPAFVWGEEKAPLPPAEYHVIKALVEARAKGQRLSTDRLRTATKDEDGNIVEDPVGALKRLRRRRDADWKSVIDMAGSPGRGYGLKDKPPTPTQKNRETRPRRPRRGRA
jgi:hypothetical protein